MPGCSGRPVRETIARRLSRRGSARPGLEVSVKIVRRRARGREGRRASAIVLALGLLALPTAAFAWTASAAPDSLVGDDLILFPQAPCTQDTVTVFVKGYVSTP